MEPGYMMKDIEVAAEKHRSARVLRRGELVSVTDIADIVGWPDFTGRGAVVWAGTLLIIPHTTVNMLSQAGISLDNGDEYFILPAPGTVVSGTAITLVRVAEVPETINVVLEPFLRELELTAEELNEKLRKYEQPNEEGLWYDVVFCRSKKQWSLA